jgi:hypothetical protein
MAMAVALDQRFWYERLPDRSLFGFLFDFDIVKAIDELRIKSVRQGKVPPQWDWRKLVKRMALSASFCKGGALEDAPLAFQGRRALWKVMEDMEWLGKT